jgi:hypothetical protein
MFYAAVVVPALSFPIPVFAWIDAIATDRNPVCSLRCDTTSRNKQRMTTNIASRSISRQEELTALLHVYTPGGRRYNARSLVGGIAQLGERLHGMQEVSGSIPLTSTTQES